MGLAVMILGLVLFLGVHTLTTQRDLRARLIASMGEGTYKVGYALVSLAGVALIVWGFSHYRATGWIDVWYPPKAFRHITLALMLPAVILVVAAYIRGRIYATRGFSNDLIAVAVGVVAYLALAFAFHPVVIGVPVVGV